MKRRILIGIACIGLGVICFALFYFFWPAPTMKAEDFNTKGQVLAMQLSELSTSSTGRTPNPEKGYMVLSDSSGKTRAFKSGQYHSCQPVWTSTGIFYGSTKSEFLTTEQGTKTIPRDVAMAGEYARYSYNDGRGFIAFGALGNSLRGYQQPVVVGDSEKTKIVDVLGAYMSMGICDDILYAVAQTKLAPNLLEQARSIYQKRTGVSNEELAKIDNFDIFVQVYPENHPHDPQVLESVPRDERFSHPVGEFQRVGDSIYLLSFLLDHPNAQRGDGKDPKAGHLVLEEWNLKQHTRRAIDIVDDKGQFVDLVIDETGGEKGILVGSEYRFVTRTGKVFSVDVTTGLAKHLYTFKELPGGGRIPRFAVTASAVYRLDNGENTNAKLNFSRYVFKTGKYEHLFDVESLRAYRRGDVHVAEIAVNPEWEKTLSQ
ncbi:hypothetical protein [Atopobium deltae]|uniref:Uncharacterized protein n=1 Tax=Atopobium deltae TaxID=1393034 RepID=A0A133XR36_9ACTN|nr:hypothetical protein [Atopobium deltae]KXB33413.1 hypothetical protein HMPREF3192_01186 [Atopobium deltae]